MASDHSYVQGCNRPGCGNMVNLRREPSGYCPKHINHIQDSLDPKGLHRSKRRPSPYPPKSNIKSRLDPDEDGRQHS